MLKEVGASGQISLGKRFAGQLFDVVFHADGRVEMLPTRAVADNPDPHVHPPTDWRKASHSASCIGTLCRASG